MKLEDIKVDIEEQFYGKVDFVGTDNIDQSTVSQEPQKVEEEQGEANIEDFDELSKQSEHLVDLIVIPLPKNLIESPAIKAIVREVSHED